MPKSELHKFLEKEILPYDELSKKSLLYTNLGVWFTPRLDRKLGHTKHRPDIYYYCHKGSVRKNVLLLGEVETGGGNFDWNLQQIKPILQQQWADNTILFQVFFPTCLENWIDISIKEGMKLERKYKGVHFYPFHVKIGKDRARRIRYSFRRGRKSKDDLRVLRREVNKINTELLKIIKKFL